LAARNGGPIGLLALVAILLAGLGLRIGYAVEQPAAQPPDAAAYARIAASLYHDGSFDAQPAGAGSAAQPSSAYAPGLPLLVAGLYFLTGGVHETLALVLLAILGAAAIPLTYSLGRRFAGPAAGLIGASVIAFYPALLEYQGLLLTEPLGATLLAASLVSYFQAADDGHSHWIPWEWLRTGALLGLLALVRPEYLPLAVLLPLAWLAREALRRRVAGGVPAVLVSLLGMALVLAPWAIHNAIELGRFVPISTGGGKALFIGTNLEADGDGVELRKELLAERPALRTRLSAAGPLNDPHRLVLEQVLARLAAESYPDLETDAALGRLGRENLEDDVTEEPLRFAGMLASKSYAAWTDAARGVMLDQPWRTLQLALVILSLGGLVSLALRGHRFEAAVAALVLLFMTAIAALLISSPRRELVVLPLLAALAGACATALVRPARG
jgi:4-amino-4-deoxy-L-arabinose transferase-like glycosyltransferase